jgi:hypothetical protein
VSEIGPPGPFAHGPLPIETVESVPLYRSHPRDYAPDYFGTDVGLNRWGAPNGEYGVCFLATEAAGAFAETFLRNRTKTLIATSQLDRRLLTVLESQRPLAIVPFYGPHLAQLGSTAEVTAGPIAASWGWSAALYHHPEQPDGIKYRLRHDNDLFGIALFDRCVQDLVVTQHWAWRDALDEFGLYERYALAID